MDNDCPRVYSESYLSELVELFGANLDEPPTAFVVSNHNGIESRGFCFGLLCITKWDTEPEPFFRILEFDKNIGWTSDEHVEEFVFIYKAIKIIQDKKVHKRLEKISRYISIALS